MGCESHGSHVGRLGANESTWLGWAYDIVQVCRQRQVPIFVKQIPLNGKLCRDASKFPPGLQCQETP